MISGGGSAQVDPVGTVAGRKWREQVWFPTSPLKALQQRLPATKVSFSSGQDVAEAVALAKSSAVAVVFAWQWEAEDGDLASFSLPEGQDKLIAAVAAANPRTVVVLETGTAVTMPWLDATGAVLEAWYAGSKGADAVADLLVGNVNPSGKLPMTFPRSEADLPHPMLVQPKGREREGVLSFKVNYDEGLKVGYKWYDAEHKPVLFPFGFGLSYTGYRYSGLTVAPDGGSATLSVKNVGDRAGVEVAEIYAALPTAANEPPKRLVGWTRVKLAPGEERKVVISIDPQMLMIWEESAKAWRRPGGEFRFMAGGSSADLPLAKSVVLP